MELDIRNKHIIEPSNAIGISSVTEKDSPFSKVVELRSGVFYEEDDVRVVIYYADGSVGASKWIGDCVALIDSKPATNRILTCDVQAGLDADIDLLFPYVAISEIDRADLPVSTNATTDHEFTLQLDGASGGSMYAPVAVQMANSAGRTLSAQGQVRVDTKASAEDKVKLVRVGIVGRSKAEADFRGFVSIQATLYKSRKSGRNPGYL